jgi:hypothetical protein
MNWNTANGHCTLLISTSRDGNAGFAAIHSFRIPGPRHTIGKSMIDVAVMDFVIPNGDDQIM